MVNVLCSHSQNWTDIGNNNVLHGPTANVYALLPDTNQSRLFIAGCFSMANNQLLGHIVGFNGNNFEPVGQGVPSGITGVAFYKNELYACGPFYNMGDSGVHYITRFDGTNWYGVGQKPNNLIRNVKSFGEYLYAYGNFSSIGGKYTGKIAKWDGSEWHPLSNYLLNWVTDVELFNNEIYVCSNFKVYVLRFGSYTNIQRQFEYKNYLFASICSYKGKLYASGRVNSGKHSLLAFDGTNWDTIAIGPSGPLNQYNTWQMKVVDDKLFLFGRFNQVNGQPAGNIAWFDGKNWGTMNGGMNKEVYAVEKFGDYIYAGGQFDSAGGVPCKYIARWKISTNEQSPLIFPETTIFPNPFSQGVSVSLKGNCSGQVHELLLFDVKGVLIRRESTLGCEFYFNGEFLPRGIYLLRIQTGEDVATHRIVKN